MSYYHKNGQKRQQHQNEENSNRPPARDLNQIWSLEQNSNGGKNNINRHNNKLNESGSYEDNIYLTDGERVRLSEIGMNFLKGNEDELVLTNLTSHQRKFMHRFAAHNGIKSRSTGSSGKRVLRLTRLRSNNGVFLTISPEAELLLDYNAMNDELTRQTNKEAGLRAAAAIVNNDPYNDEWLNDDRETFGYCLVPPPPFFHRNNDPYLNEKSNLPIYKEREQFLNLLNEHPVIIVSGETGSGKTTQIPQYILEESNYNNTPCHIVVTQPRRIAAIAVATRVAEERGERCGQTVGYQVRLKSATSKSTCLVYTTSGSFLRAIMCRGPETFRSITHLIIDEIHERDKDTDFTLITVKKELQANTNLRIILMSATMDINLLSAYFDGCPVITVPGQSYEIKIFHLEEVLWYTGYETDAMTKILNKYERMSNGSDTPKSAGETVACPELRDAVDNTIISVFKPTFDRTSLDPLYQLEYYIRNEGVPINYLQTYTCVTPLMVACKLNNPAFVQTFLKYGANIDICDVRGETAYDYAKLNYHDCCSHFMKKARDLTLLKKTMKLKTYLSTTNQNEVDHNLILSLIQGLLRKGDHGNGTIMVFLPGYADIVQQRELLQNTFPYGSLTLYILHGNMSTEDQNKALLPTHNRKIILSTNIGQTSITIPDLVYVIDSGKIKMKQYESVTESTQLQEVWISKADAFQRSGRAGRRQNGICYRLYSIDQFESMYDYSVPEFLRIPLTDICLYAKTLRPNTSVEEYLSQALNQPSMMNIAKAIEKLKILNIFSDDESVTPLGKFIAELPIDVQLGKCLVYSIFLRCYQSVLTIVAYHSVKEPFVLSADRQQQGLASFQRKSFSGKSFSDHIGILNLYEKYMQMQRFRKTVTDFCEKYFLSQACMEQFVASRRHLSEVVARYFRTNYKCNEFNNNFEMIRYALTAGLYPNVAYIDRRTVQVRSGDDRHLIIQRSSSLNPPGMKTLKDYIHKLPFDWVIYYEKSRLHCNTNAINVNTIISPFMMILQCGKSLKIEYIRDEKTDEEEDIDDPDDYGDADADRDDNDGDGDNDDVDTYFGGATYKELRKYIGSFKMNANRGPVTAKISLDNWIKFQCSEKHADQLLMLRLLLEKEFNTFLAQKELDDNNKLTITILQKLLAINAI